MTGNAALQIDVHETGGPYVGHEITFAIHGYLGELDFGLISGFNPCSGSVHIESPDGVVEPFDGYFDSGCYWLLYDSDMPGEVYKRVNISYIPTSVGEKEFSCWILTGYGFLHQIYSHTFTILPPSLTLRSLNASEVVRSGTIVTATWDTLGDVSQVKIEFSTDAGETWNEVDPPNQGNTGTYIWTVPQVTSKQCLLRISDASNASISDQSDSHFTIWFCQKELQGDINHDCYVNLEDLAIIMQEWLACGNPLDPSCRTTIVDQVLE